MAVPGDRHEGPVVPLRSDPCPVPCISPVVQDEDESLLAAEAAPLHDVEIVVRVEHRRCAACIVFVGPDKGRYAGGLPVPAQTEGIIVLPEHAGIAFMGQDDGVGEELVVHDPRRVSAAEVVVVHEGHCLEGTVFHEHACLREPAQAEAVGVAQLLQAVAERKVEGADAVFGPVVDVVEPGVDVLVACPAFPNAEDGDRPAFAHIGPVVDRPDDPAAEALDKVVAETVEADLLDHPLGMVQDAG